MREILFRGKRKDNGEWVKGMLLATDVIIPCGQDFFIEANSIIDAVFTGYEVIPETVGQYTGLTDKNGKKIFEGDIVKRFWLGMKIIYKITYESKHACFIGKAINTSGFTTFDNDGKKYEIIGNIYDNPEHLKGGAE